MRKTAVRAVALAAVCFLSVFGTCSYAKEATSEPIQIVVLVTVSQKDIAEQTNPSFTVMDRLWQKRSHREQENHICIRTMRKTDLPLENSTKRC